MITDFPKESHIPGLRALWKEAFGDTDAFLDSFFSTGFSMYRCMCIREGNRPLAALYWFDCHWQDKRLAYVYAVATAKSHRGQGLCHKLMEATHRLLLQLGYSGVVLVPAKQALFGFYEKMGYGCFGGITQWDATAGKPLALKRLDYKQYCAVRDRYLTDGAVLQNGATMRFLSTYTHFYQGEDFLVCGAQEDGKWMAYELLGNTDAAPGILGALQLESGTFRCPGSTPFAMYLSLTQDKQTPDYFAFALD